MTVSTTVRLRGDQTVVQWLMKVKDRLNDREKALIGATQAVATEWEANFRSGGARVGGWADLAEATIQNRERQGFPAGPILIRYGALKRVTTDEFINARGEGSWSGSDPYSKHTTTGRLTIKKGLAHLEAHGWKVANQYGHPNSRGSAPVPPRPFWFVDRQVTAAAGGAVRDWLLDEVLKP